MLFIIIHFSRMFFYYIPIINVYKTILNFKNLSLFSIFHQHYMLAIASCVEQEYQRNQYSIDKVTIMIVGQR